MNSIYKQMDLIDDNESLNEKYNVRTLKDVKKLQESTGSRKVDYKFKIQLGTHTPTGGKYYFIFPERKNPAVLPQQVWDLLSVENANATHFPTKAAAKEWIEDNLVAQYNLNPIYESLAEDMDNKSNLVLKSIDGNKFLFYSVAAHRRNKLDARLVSSIKDATVFPLDKRDFVEHLCNWFNKNGKEFAFDHQLKVEECNEPVNLDESKSLTEAPINGTGSVVNYNNEVKDLLANVERLIQAGTTPDAVYQLIMNNMEEDIQYKIQFYARHGGKLVTLISYYQKCIDAFTNAFPAQQNNIQSLNSALTQIRSIVSNTPSCKK